MYRDEYPELWSVFTIWESVLLRYYNYATRISISGQGIALDSVTFRICSGRGKSAGSPESGLMLLGYL
jgi:hypothetical protein